VRARWALLITTLTLGFVARGQEAPSLGELTELKREALAVFSEVLSTGSAAERLSAVTNLVRYGDDSVIPLLTERLLGDDASFVRRAVAEGLVRFRSPQVSQALRHAARNDSVASIRWAAAVSLREIDVLRDLLRERETLAAAAISLQEPASTARLPGAVWPSAEIALIGAFSDRETFNLVERAAMLKALAQLGSLAAISLAQWALADSTEDPFVRGSAAFALGALNVRNAIPELLAALSTDLEAIQVGAASALGHFGDPIALEPLSVLLRTAQSSQARIAAANALASFGPSAVSALAQALLTDPVPAVRQAALRALSQIGGPTATQAVLALLQSSYLQQCDPTACGGLALEMLQALAELGQAQLALQVTQATLAALRDVLPFLFIFAENDLVQTLSVVGRAAPQLFDLLLSDPSPFVRALGVASFANVYHAAARELLLKALSDENPLVRRAALEGLAPWATPDDVQIFAPFGTDRDPRSRVAALFALARAGDARALEPLRVALRSESLSVRLDAAGAALAFTVRWASRASSPSLP
jgi:HEAT repeat protein